MISKDTLELCYLSLNLAVAKTERFPEGTSGYSLNHKYRSALYEINNLISSFDASMEVIPTEKGK